MKSLYERCSFIISNVEEREKSRTKPNRANYNRNKSIEWIHCEMEINMIWLLMHLTHSASSHRPSCTVNCSSSFPVKEEKKKFSVRHMQRMEKNRLFNVANKCRRKQKLGKLPANKYIKWNKRKLTIFHADPIIFRSSSMARHDNKKSR